MEHGWHEGCLEDRQFGCCEKTGNADVAQNKSGAYSERKMPVSEKLMFTVLGLLVLVNILDVTRMLAAWKISVTFITEICCFMQEA